MAPLVQAELEVTEPEWTATLHKPGSTEFLDYVLCVDELGLYGFPIDADCQVDGWEQTSSQNDDKCTGQAPRVFGLDCEMVRTVDGPQVARIALVELVLPEIAAEPTKAARFSATTCCSTVLDVLALPPAKITDYITAVTGIMAETLADVTLTLAAAKHALLKHVSANDILIGHGLENDLQCLRIRHGRVIDTAVLFPHHDGWPSRRRLVELAGTFLGRTIQSSGHAHNPVDDAVAAVELAALVVREGRGRVRRQILRVPASDLAPEIDPGGNPSAGNSAADSSMADFLHLQDRALRGELTPAHTDDILQALGLIPNDVSCVYLHGSRAVGTQRRDGSQSDWDFWIILREGSSYAVPPLTDYALLQFGQLEAVVFSFEQWRTLVRQCTIWVHEAIWSPSCCRFRESVDWRQEFRNYTSKTPREAWLPLLRSSVSLHSGKKLGSAKAAFTRGNAHRCAKHLFIGFRFLVYGIELARTGELQDIACVNWLWWEFLERDSWIALESWTAYLNKYGSRFEEFRREFRAVAPKLKRFGGFRAGGEAEFDDTARLNDTRSLAHMADVAAAAAAACSQPQRPMAVRKHHEREPAVLTFLNRYREDRDSGLLALQAAYGVVARHHESFPNLVQLRYSTSSPEGVDVPDSARGVICEWRPAAPLYERGHEELTKGDTEEVVGACTAPPAGLWVLVAYPFERFFNLGEKAAPSEFDWGTAQVFDKIDGSLAILYHYEGSWRVASSRRPDASGGIGLATAVGRDHNRDKNLISLRELFWQVWHAEQYDLPPTPSSDSEARCYMFEVSTFRHPIIIRYGMERLTLIGCRDMNTLKELCPVAIARKQGWRAAATVAVAGWQRQEADTEPGMVPKMAGHSGTDREDIAAVRERAIMMAAAALNTETHEGFVLCDASFRRLKVKTPGYVRASWMFPLCERGGDIDTKRCLRIVLAGAAAEFKLYSPHNAQKLDEVEAKFETWKATVQAVFDDLKAGVGDYDDTAASKAFAEEAKKHEFRACLFDMWNHPGASPGRWVAMQKPKKGRAEERFLQLVLGDIQ